MNESIVSTELGLKGILHISESINLYRDIEILNYTGGKIHIPYVTTSKGVELIREAKKIILMLLLVLVLLILHILKMTFLTLILTLK